MNTLRDQIIRLAHANPGEVQDALLPLLIQKTAGGQSFSNYGHGTNLSRVFEDLREEAQREYGYNGYTGSIAEKGGVSLRSRTPMSIEDARQYARKDTDNNDKWDEAAFAVPVAKVKVLGGKEYAVKVKARTEEEAYITGREMIKAKGRTRKGAQVQVKDIYVSKARGGGKPKVVFVKDEETWYTTDYSRSKDRKDALVSAKQSMSRDGVKVGARAEVRQVKRLGYVEKQGEAVSSPVWTVTAIRQQVVLGGIEGYLFYGWASS
jgi:hypothetical protein